MKRLAWLLLLPLASGVLFGASAPFILPAPPLTNGTVGAPYATTFSLSIGTVLASWSYSGSLPPGLTLPSGTGTSASISGTPTAAGPYSFTVQAVIGGTTNAPTTVTQAYTLTISLPTLSLTSGSLPGGVVGAVYSQAVTATGGYGPGTYTFALVTGSLPPGLLLNSTSGVIYSTPTTVGSYSFSLQVTSQSGTYPPLTAFGTFSINISPPPLTITTTSLPAGTVGAAYSQALAATGGTPPYTWRLTPGNSLPGGLTLASSGTISGTPTAAGSFTFQVTVSDSQTQPASAAGGFTIQINPAALVITTTSLPGGTVGTAYTATTLAATGGTSPYTWSVASGALPSGLSLSAAGVITGTPNAAGTFSVTLKVTDSALPLPATATQTFSVIVVAVPPLSITTQTPLPGGEVGVAYTQAFAATGGTSPYTWSISAGAATTGLTLSAAGSLTGTPTAAGPFNFTVQVTDSAGRTATAPFAITVAAALAITTATLPNGTVGTPYSQALAATGGTAPFTWSVSTGALPTGLTLSAAGSLTGTPTAAGKFSFTIQVVDAAKATASQSFTITITAALTITTATLPNGIVGTAYTPTTLVATGGTSPYTWSSSGALPTGLTLSAAGSLTGTPIAAGTFNFTIQAADAAKATATQSFTITIAAALTITTATLPNGTVGTAYSPPTLTAANVNGTLTWSISTGALPGGITLNSSAGSLSGTPTAPGTFTFTVSVTGGGQTATQSFTITVGVPPGPSATITGLPATATPAMQPPLVAISIPSEYPLAITGTVTLTFASDAPSTDDPEVVFINGGRTASFTVAANTTQVVFPGGTPSVQIGTVSGTITLTLDLVAAGIDITPSPAPSTNTVIPKSAPVINSGGVTVTGVTSSGFNIVVVGYATSRDMVSATVTFTAASGVTLSSSSASVPLTSAFTTWYQSSASAQYGSNFSLTMPFTITNGTSTNPLTSVSVQLTNSQGNSTTMSTPY